MLISQLRPLSVLVSNFSHLAVSSNPRYLPGYPIISHFMARVQTTQGGFNLGGINATGQVAEMPGNWAFLIDLETPQEVYTKADYINGEDWNLVFSDEFNTDGRTFYPGDDPYWEAVDLHYWQTVRICTDVVLARETHCIFVPGF